MFDNFDDLFLSDDNPEMIPLFNLEEDDDSKSEEKFPTNLPLLALKNTVLFPGIVSPINIGREKSIKAVEAAYEGDKYIGVLSQKNAQIPDPTEEDLYAIGTIATVERILTMPDGSKTAIIRGRKSFNLKGIYQSNPYLAGKIGIRNYVALGSSPTFKALISSIRDKAKEIIDLSPNIPNDAMFMLRNITIDSFLLNFIASNLSTTVDIKQEILSFDNLEEKAQFIFKQMDNELKILRLKSKIEGKVKGNLDKQQRDFFLTQQLKTIQEELGQNPQQEQFDKLEKRANEKNWDDSVKKVFFKELEKIKRTPPQMAEFSNGLSYLELMLDLPWNEHSEDNFDLDMVKATLDEDHYGLDKVKERILEHLAVLKLKGDMKAPILCLWGPPGVGKTSLGMSIARAINRKMARISLGGLHDESEIRGHRKTYIGAMPGRIIQSLKKVKYSNPVFILDEIDKVGKDFRGDPSSALLEVLDPEQNMAFHDNYLDTEYDLSKVLFIATANNIGTIQPALRDRMEMIHISGYSLEEKLEIAKRHIIAKEIKEHGLKKSQIKIPVAVLRKLIANYTREAGVRALRQKIAGLLRYAAKEVAMNNKKSVAIKVEMLTDILGPEPFPKDVYNEILPAGVAVGLAWTSVGGEILYIETSKNEGAGKLTLTGNLGNVMKESATTALSFIKAHTKELKIDPEVFKKTDFHIHVPEGAIPKDGPSAGITMLTAITSSLLKKPVKKHLAMTGEITLRGKVLPVGGIKEKILAAKRANMKEIILCQANQKHIEQIDPVYLKGLKFHYVDRMEEVIKIALK